MPESYLDFLASQSTVAQLLADFGRLHGDFVALMYTDPDVFDDMDGRLRSVDLGSLGSFDAIHLGDSGSYIYYFLLDALDGLHKKLSQVFVAFASLKNIAAELGAPNSKIADLPYSSEIQRICDNAYVNFAIGVLFARIVADELERVKAWQRAHPHSN